MNTKSGKTIELRLAEPTDAEFIYGLRMDSRLNQHLSPVTGTAQNQRQWLEEYKKREAAGSEYYFIIMRRDSGKPIGTVRLYDFIGERESFCWGSWILNDDKTKYAAVESAMLVYDIGFNELKFSSCHFVVRKGNERVISFHKRFGACQVGEDDDNLYFMLSPETYNAFYLENRQFLCE